MGPRESGSRDGTERGPVVTWKSDDVARRLRCGDLQGIDTRKTCYSPRFDYLNDISPMKRFGVDFPPWLGTIVCHYGLPP